MSNRTIIQYFEWYVPNDGKHWQRTAQDAAHLANLGITDVWLPPAYKAHTGMNDVGYGVYDLYDLGEFDQKGTIPTKYGTKDEYLAAIQAIHQQGMRVMADIVLNHRMGGDYCEEAETYIVDDNDRRKIVGKLDDALLWTGFNFPGRNGKYSDFTWNKNHFSGADYNQRTGFTKVMKIRPHVFATKVDSENGNYDYLMGNDVDFSVPEVQEELIRWGKWYLDFTGVDSLRLDAIKHISFDFYPIWLKAMREYKGENIFAVGEYWSADIYRLSHYLDIFAEIKTGLNENLLNLLRNPVDGDTRLPALYLEGLKEYLDSFGKSMHLFDVPLQDHFKRASESDNTFRMDQILQGTVLELAPECAVTFVDNHDTQETQMLHNWVAAWFKPLAYALILLRDKGTPCVFYGDLYGVPFENKQPVRELEALLHARKTWATGWQEDYLDHGNVIGWTREGGLAVVMSNGDDGWKDMYTARPNTRYYDLLGNVPGTVCTNENGVGHFTVKSRSVSVWVTQE